MVSLTHYDLKELKSNCQRIVDTVKIIEHQEVKKLFENRQDYANALEEKIYLPEKYYNFRYFDVYGEINFNERLKKYQIKLTKIYSKVLDRYKTNQRNTESFVISESFDEVLDVFHDVIIDVLENLVVSNHLAMDIY